MTNDIDELTALNLDFVASAQNSDVRRFDEILAPEFYFSNPDKSLVDRAAFLEQTAKPVAIRTLDRLALAAPPCGAGRRGRPRPCSMRLRAHRCRGAFQTGSWLDCPGYRSSFCLPRYISRG